MTDTPTAGSASVHILHEGYVRDDPAGDRVGSSVTLILDAGRVIVVDPGMVADRDGLIAALAAHGPAPGDVTDLVFSHHHPDHTVNAALFPGARIHDHWATYDGDLWIGREPGEFGLTPSVRIVPAPGHTPEDIATLAATQEGVYACTHGGGPAGHRGTGAACQQGAHPRHRGRDHPRPRPCLPPQSGHAKVARPG